MSVYQEELVMSEKESLLVKKTYRQVTEQYYEMGFEHHVQTIINLNSLLCATISTKRVADTLGVLSTL